jgi:iron complex outermembrane receptor protein
LSAVRQLPSIVSGGGIEGYTELDLRLAWRGWRRMEISVVGQNLLHDRHTEFGAPAQRGDVERGVYARVAWGF